MGRADEWGGRGGRDWGEAAGFVRRSRFSPYTKREATRKSGMAASVCRPRLHLAPLVIDPTRKAVGNKKNYRSNGPGEKRVENLL
jgi:hypothetical protein